MADIVLTIDPDDTSFALHDRANGRRLMGFDAPVPETDSQWAFSADTEGERRANLRYRNRVITAQVLLDRSTAALLEALENTLGQKVSKLAREGGELRFTYPSGVAITFNVLEASYQRTFDIADMAKFRAQYEISFICEPFGLGTEVDMGDNTETTLPVLVFTETGILGDVPGLGRLVIDNDSATANQWWMTWGIESLNYSSSANAALFYEAEGRTLMTDSALAVGAGTVSGGGSNTVRNTALGSDYKALLSTQATGGGAHLSHVGSFRVYARVNNAGTTGEVSVALEWSEGDFLAYTRNTPVAVPFMAPNTWRLVDLGIVTTRLVTSGTQRWEGRIIAKSSVASSDFLIDYLFLVPVSEGSGIASGVLRFPAAPTTFNAEDHFTSTTAGNALNARVAPTGGTWATSGDATDFAFDDDTFADFVAGEHIKRSVSSGTNGRYAILGSTNYTNVIVHATAGQNDFPHSSQTTLGPQMGVIARWTDSSNHLRAVIRLDPVAGISSLEIHEILATTKTIIASDTTTLGTGAAGFFDNTLWKVELTADVTGRVSARVITPAVASVASGSVILSASTTRASLATGGTLATGKPGIFDLYPGSTTTITRYYDDFLVYTPPPDAAAFASQSMEVRHDRVQREDSAGVLWTPVSSYEGDYLRVPVAGAEARTLRTIVKMSRSDPTSSDGGIDDISARLFVTPRFLVVPDA